MEKKEIGITVDKLISGSSSSEVGAFYKVNGEKKEQISGEEYRELLATYTQAGKLIFKEFREENVVY